MSGSLWTRKRLVLAALGAISVAATAYVSAPLAYPRPVASLLGPAWECSKVAFLTTCTRHEPVEPAIDRLSKRVALGRRI